MLEVITGVTVFTILCLATKALRLYGVVGLAILSMIYPFVALALALIGGVAYLLFFHRSTLTK
jgi:hypothetical protein